MRPRARAPRRPGLPPVAAALGGADPAAAAAAGAPIAIEMDWSVSEALAGASWEVKYIVDMTAKRHIVELGATAAEDFAAGAHKFRFHVAGLDLTGVKPSWLNNVGLLLAVLKGGGGEEIFQINCVTQVRKGEDGDLLRTVLSPLE